MNMPVGGRVSPRTTEFVSAGSGAARCQAGGKSTTTRRASGPAGTFSCTGTGAIAAAGFAVGAAVAVGVVVGAVVGATHGGSVGVGVAPEQPTRMLKATEAARIVRFIGSSKSPTATAKG